MKYWSVFSNVMQMLVLLLVLVIVHNGYGG